MVLPVLNDPPTFRTEPPGRSSMVWRRKKVRDQGKELQLEFLKNLNHHVRTPLNTIVLLTDLLIQLVPPDEEEIHSALLTIAGASSHLERVSHGQSARKAAPAHGNDHLSNGKSRRSALLLLRSVKRFRRDDIEEFLKACRVLALKGVG